MIEALRTLAIDGKGIKTAQELKERILEALRQQPEKSMLTTEQILPARPEGTSNNNERKERRRFVRLDMSAGVNYRVLESLRDHIKSYTKNVSEKGIMISLSERLEPNTLLEINIKFPDDTKPICGIGKIVWIKRNPHSKDFDAGIDITYIRNEDKARFVKYLKQDKNGDTYFFVDRLENGIKKI